MEELPSVKWLNREVEPNVLDVLPTEVPPKREPLSAEPRKAELPKAEVRPAKFESA
jgi:hypothetical protein